MSLRPTAAIKAAAVICSVALTLAVATGCSSTKKDPTPAPTSTAARPTPVTTSPTLVQNPLPTKIPNDKDVRKDVVQTKCAAAPGGWAAAGTITNSADKARTYKIIVFFTTTSATTLDFATADVSVAPGKSAPWQASKKFAAQKHMLCPMPGITAS